MKRFALAAAALMLAGAAQAGTVTNTVVITNGMFQMPTFDAASVTNLSLTLTSALGGTLAVTLNSTQPATAGTSATTYGQYFGDFSYTLNNTVISADSATVTIPRAVQAVGTTRTTDIPAYSYTNTFTTLNGLSGGTLGCTYTDGQSTGSTPATGYNVAINADSATPSCTLAYTITTQDATAVPEPGSLALIGLGLAGLGFAARRRQA